VVEVSDPATDVTLSSFIASMESRLAAVYSHAMSLADHGQPRSRHRRARSQHNATIQVNQAHISYQIFSSDLKCSRNYCCSRRGAAGQRSEGQWLNYSARAGGSLQARHPMGQEQRWGFRLPTRDFRAFKELTLTFMAFK